MAAPAPALAFPALAMKGSATNIAADAAKDNLLMQLSGRPEGTATCGS
jgi:hypothetical protein